MGRHVHAVGPGERAGAVRRRGDPGRVADVAERVGSQRVGDHAGALADQRLERVEVERAVGRVDRGDADHQAAVLRGPEPRADVGVVVELRDDHLVAGRERARDRVREEEVERRHVGAEGDLAGLGAEEVGRRLVGGGEQRVGLARAGEGAAGVRVRALQVAAHRLDHGGRHLRAAGAVEVGDRPAADARAQRREALPDRVEVEGGGGRRAHAAMLAARRRISSRARWGSTTTPPCGPSPTGSGRGRSPTAGRRRAGRSAAT